MTVKTTFRGGGGGERPENYGHSWPQVRQTGGGLDPSQFPNQYHVQDLDAHQLAAHSAEKQSFGVPKDPDPWRPFPKGADTKGLGWTN